MFRKLLKCSCMFVQLSGFNVIFLILHLVPNIEAVPCSDELYKKVEGTCGVGFSVNTDSCLCEKGTFYSCLLSAICRLMQWKVFTMHPVVRAYCTPG